MCVAVYAKHTHTVSLLFNWRFVLDFLQVVPGSQKSTLVSNWGMLFLQAV